MKPESQVCSLELAKKLKELGVKQESLFYYSNGHLYSIRDNISEDGYEMYPEKEEVAAFTVAELGEMLPEWVYSKRAFLNDTEDWFIYTLGEPKNYREPRSIMMADTEADARAKTLVYLIENDLLKVK